MRVRTIILVGGTIFYDALCPLGHSQTQQSSEAIWSLTHGFAVKDAGPHAYKFTIDHNSENSTGETCQRQRFTAEYTRGLPGGEVMRRHATQATADGATAPFDTGQKHDFVEGFRYRDDQVTESLLITSPGLESHRKNTLLGVYRSNGMCAPRGRL